MSQQPGSRAHLDPAPSRPRSVERTHHLDAESWSWRSGLSADGPFPAASGRRRGLSSMCGRGAGSEDGGEAPGGDIFGLDGR